jgi:hypothetical protein
MYIHNHSDDEPGTRFGLHADPVVADPVAEIGAELWLRAPAGVTVGIYDPNDAELTRRGKEWGAREGALGIKARRIDAAELVFGKALADSGGFVRRVTDLGKALASAVAKAAAPRAPAAGTGPSLIRTLALFTHGTRSWLGIGNGFTLKNAATVVRGIAPYLTIDFNLIIFGCSAGRGQREASNWVVTTMEPGGADSLAGVLRDALVDEGKSRARVWAHTEVGHTTRNPSLRVFTAAAGKGSAGESYASGAIFGGDRKATAAGEVEAAIRALGRQIPARREATVRAAIDRLVRQHMYAAWVRATATTKTVAGTTTRVTNLTLRGAPLPEMAPLYPAEVADIARKYWSDTYWTDGRRKDVATALVRRLGLPR